MPTDLVEPDRPAVCMVFDEGTGNAIDAFAYTPENLRLKEQELHGTLTLTLGSRFVSSLQSSLACRLSADLHERRNP